MLTNDFRYAPALPAVWSPARHTKIPSYDQTLASLDAWSMHIPYP